MIYFTFTRTVSNYARYGSKKVETFFMTVFSIRTAIKRSGRSEREMYYYLKFLIVSNAYARTKK